MFKIINIPSFEHLRTIPHHPSHHPTVFMGCAAAPSIQFCGLHLLGVSLEKSDLRSSLVEIRHSENR